MNGTEAPEVRTVGKLYHKWKATEKNKEKRGQE
jgi:hypothetical protein